MIRWQQILKGIICATPWWETDRDVYIWTVLRRIRTNSIWIYIHAIRWRSIGKCADESWQHRRWFSPLESSHKCLAMFAILSHNNSIIDHAPYMLAFYVLWACKDANILYVFWCMRARANVSGWRREGWMTAYYKDSHRQSLMVGGTTTRYFAPGKKCGSVIDSLRAATGSTKSRIKWHCDRVQLPALVWCMRFHWNRTNVLLIWIVTRSLMSTNGERADNALNNVVD